MLYEPRTAMLALSAVRRLIKHIDYLAGGRWYSADMEYRMCEAQLDILP